MSIGDLVLCLHGEIRKVPGHGDFEDIASWNIFYVDCVSR